MGFTVILKMFLIEVCSIIRTFHLKWEVLSVFTFGSGDHQLIEPVPPCRPSIVLVLNLGSEELKLQCQYDEKLWRIRHIYRIFRIRNLKIPPDTDKEPVYLETSESSI